MCRSTPISLSSGERAKRHRPLYPYGICTYTIEYTRRPLDRGHLVKTQTTQTLIPGSGMTLKEPLYSYKSVQPATCLLLHIHPRRNGQWKSGAGTGRLPKSGQLPRVIVAPVQADADADVLEISARSLADPRSYALVRILAEA